MSEIDEEPEDVASKYIIENELIDLKTDEDFVLMEVTDEQGSEPQYTIVNMPKIDVAPAPTVLNYQVPTLMKQVPIRPIKKMIAKPSPKSSLRPLSKFTLNNLRTNFYNSPKNAIAQNICSQLDPVDVLISRVDTNETIFSHKIDMHLNEELKNRKFWCHTAFTILRVPFMRQYNLEEFEFSQAHFFYWDKIERSYYFLNNIVETAKRGEEVGGRLVSFLLSDPIGDGGQWDMIVNIINKHGVMPKKCFPESFSSESSARMNAILKSKLREYSKVLRELMKAGAPNEEVQAKVDEQMGEIYNIVGICLGIPPEKFTWEYYDKNKKYFSVGPITPIEFYEQCVKPFFNVDDKVCLVTDPRPSNEFDKGYTVDCLGNVVGGRPVFYNNQPVDILIGLVSQSIQNHELVQFTCDLQGLSSYQLERFNLLCDVEMSSNLDKTERLSHRDTSSKVSMVFTGMNETATKFLIEPLLNSKKTLSIDSGNFSKIVSDIVINKKHLSDNLLKIFTSEPIVLDAWDCLGDLVL